MTIFYARPYDMTVPGFYFETLEEFSERARALRNESGQPVEEFEIQFIDGEEIDAALADAWELTQGNVGRFLEVVDEWSDDQKRRFVIVVGECGYAFDRMRHDPDDFDLDIYPAESLREFAEHCIEDGWFGPVAEVLAPYIDYDGIARELGMDYCETEIAGERLVYRCA